jgi:hypothetical protein
MKKKWPIAPSETRRPQLVPDAVRDEILTFIRQKFYTDFPTERFYADRRLLLRFVVFAPAVWLTEKSLTLPLDRYREIMVGAKDGILPVAARMGEPPKNPVKYLGWCVQNRLASRQAEGWLEEAKALRNKVDPVLNAIAGLAAPTMTTVDPVEAMAAAARELAQASKRLAAAPTGGRKPKQAKPDPQLGLF